ncbi:Putative S-adenosylmethionine carrier 2 [Picochlorum sp. SENEW3]|nr:Putative S-adenosylmethionine carrier 2 [Picochlorum sp. SENEW3]
MAYHQRRQNRFQSSPLVLLDDGETGLDKGAAAGAQALLCTTRESGVMEFDRFCLNQNTIKPRSLLVAGRRQVVREEESEKKKKRTRQGGGRMALLASVSRVGTAGHVEANEMCTIASAAENSSLHPNIDTNAPMWRITAGNLAAGATAGCAVEAALYPIDTIKTRLQAMRSGGGVGALLKSGGGRSLYAGVWGNLAGVGPASAVFMAVYEPVKKAVLSSVPENKSFLGPLMAGVAAGLASSVIRVPTEVVKTRMQTGEFTHATKALKSIVTREGMRGMFAGYGSFLLRDLPFDAIEFVTYEQLKKGYKTLVLKDSRDLNPGEHSVFGAGAGAATGLVTTPLDVLKTRLMIQGQSGKYKNVWDCAVKICQEEGPRALFKGWQPRVIWIGVGGSVFFTVLEASKTFYAPKKKAVSE